METVASTQTQSGIPAALDHNQYIEEVLAYLNELEEENVIQESSKYQLAIIFTKEALIQRFNVNNRVSGEGEKENFECCQPYHSLSQEKKPVSGSKKNQKLLGIYEKATKKQ